jgi:PAS domain S-box-containing protein
MSDEKLSLKLLEVYPAPTVIHDYNNFVYVNNAAVKKFRATSKSDLIGKPILDFVHPSSLQETIKSLQSSERNDTFEMHDLHLLAQDGTSFYSDIVGTTITMDGKECVHLLINDITQLRNSEQRYRSLYELAPEAILLEDEDGFILDANPAFFNLLGYTREETIGQHVRFLTLEKDPGIIRNDIKKVIAGEVLIQESFGKCKNGKVINVQLTESAFPLENNRMGLISIMVDITSRKKAEAEVKALNSTLEARVIERTEELNAANKELEAFAYTVSHDLRAPLRAIDGFSKILMEDYYDSLDDQGRVVCKVISDNAETMGQLIDELLQFSRLSRSELHFLPVDLNPIITSLYEMLTTPEQREKIKFSCPKLPIVKADPLMIKQVWQNLLSNAIKFSRKVDKPTVTIDFYRNIDSVVFTVEDNGAGFNMKYATKLFGVFQRLHTVKEFEGTGVGLAIVQRIVHRHGGKVWAESEINSGAKFYFTLKNAETGK